MAQRPGLPPPFLKRVTLIPERAPAEKAHPFDLPLFRDGAFELDFERPVTVVVGENGVGKSTLLEAIAGQIGFSMQSGTRNFASDEALPPLAQCLRLAWLPKVTTGFFLRAESFFNLATQIDELGVVERDRIWRGRPQDTSHWRILAELFAEPARFYAEKLDRQRELF